MKNSILALMLALSFSAHAKVEVIASSGELNLNLPELTYLNHSQVEIAQDGTVAFTFNAFSGGKFRYAISFGKKSNDQQYFILDENEIMGSFSLYNNADDEAQAVFATHDGNEYLGIFNVSLNSMNRTTLLKTEGMRSAIAYPSLNSSGVLSYRVTYPDRTQEVISSDLEEFKKILSTKESSLGKFSYIFTPVSSGDYLLVKVRMGDKLTEDMADRLYMYNKKTKRYYIVLQDRDAMPSSKVTEISNQYSVAANGDYSVWVKMTTGVTLLQSQSGIPRSVLKLGNVIKSYDAFAPSINEKGNILVRGKLPSGKNSMFLYDGVGAWKSLNSQGSVKTINDKKYYVTEAYIGMPKINNNLELAYGLRLKNTESGKSSTMIIKESLK